MQSRADMVLRYPRFLRAGRWRMADGGWRMADGGWRMADGARAYPPYELTA